MAIPGTFQSFIALAAYASKLRSEGAAGVCATPVREIMKDTAPALSSERANRSKAQR
jgi:hypothetical protein